MIRIILIKTSDCWTMSLHENGSLTSWQNAYANKTVPRYIESVTALGFMVNVLNYGTIRTGLDLKEGLDYD